MKELELLIEEENISDDEDEEMSGDCRELLDS